jgi:hypothetical protein
MLFRLQPQQADLKAVVVAPHLHRCSKVQPGGYAMREAAGGTSAYILRQGDTAPLTAAWHLHTSNRPFYSSHE